MPVCGHNVWFGVGAGGVSGAALATLFVEFLCL